MTREEAIKRIEDHMIHHHMGEYPHIFIGEALDMAIAALREQEEREKGCKFCDNGEQYSTYDKYGTNLTLAFCPMCGQRLEEV